MKKLLFAAIALALILSAPAWGTQLLEENFNYTAGQLITANGWTAHSGSGTNAITVVSPGITYTNYLSNVGNCVGMTTSGEDDNKAITSQTTGTVYASMLVTLTAANTTGDYFTHFCQSSGSGAAGFFTRFFAKRDASNNVAFAVSKASTAPTYSGFTYALNTTYLIVLRYKFVSGATNDSCDVFINPTLGATEPAVTLSCADIGAADATGIAAIALRQGTAANASTQKIDGIRVGTTWADVALAAEPTTQASGVNFTNIQSNQMTVNWTRGNGDNCIVLAHQGAPVDADPVDLATYTASAAFGSGSEIGTGNRVVYSGASNSVTVTNLSPSTAYYYAVYEYSGSTMPNYMLTPATGNTTTSGGGSPTVGLAGAFSNFGTLIVGGSTASQNYTVWGSSLTANVVVTAPANFQVSTDNANFFSSRTLSLAGDSVPHTTIYARFSPAATGIKADSIANASTGATTVYISCAGTGIRPEPVTQASALGFSNVGADTMTVGWTRGNGDSCIVLARQGSDLSSGPVDATNYAASAGFGGGSAVGGGYVMYKGTGTSVKLSGLAGGTTYYVNVYEYNSDGSNAENYLLATPASGNYTTAIVPFVWNQAGTADWTVGANWTPNRGSPAPSDVLVFNGGGAVTVTNVPTQTIAQLSLDNNTTVNLQAGAANTLTIAGGSGTDLIVPAGCALNINGASALTILLGAGASGSISGNMSFTTAPHRLDATDASAVAFNSGSSLTQGTGCTGNILTNTGTASAVVFTSGSSFIQSAGSNPFALTQPNSKVVFQHGSLFKMQQNATPSFSGRTYSNFELDYATAVDSATGGAILNIDNLTVTNGTLKVGMTGSFNLKGDVFVANGATLNFDAVSNATINFADTVAHTISGTGTLIFGANENVRFNNSVGITLQRDITIADSLTIAQGTLDDGGHTINCAKSVYIGDDPTAHVGSGRIRFTGGAGPYHLYNSGDISACGYFGNIELDDATTGHDLALTNDIRATNVAITNGVLDCGGFLIVTEGNWANAAGLGHFLPNGGTVSFIGSAGAQTVSADSFASIVVTNADGIQLLGDVKCMTDFSLYDGVVNLNGHVLVYGPSASLSYISDAAQQTTTDAEFPASSGPHSLVIDNTSGLGVNLHADRTINGTLSLNNGLLSTGINVLTVGNGGSATRGNGYVFGNLRKYFPANAKADWDVGHLFEVGTAGEYSPDSISFHNVATPGYVTVTAVRDSNGYANSNDSLSASKRHWKFLKDGAMAFDSCRVRFWYNDADFNANFTPAAEDTMKVGCRYYGGAPADWRWDFFPKDNSSSADNWVEIALVPGSDNGYEKFNSDFLFGSGYGIAGGSWLGVANGDKPAAALPKVFALSKPYPNPARGRATLTMALPDARAVRLDIYNMLGQRVATLADGAYPAGVHQLAWDLRGSGGGAVTNGVYFYHLVAGNKTVTGKLTVLR